MTITVNNLLVGHKIVTGNIIKIRRQQPVDHKNKNKENDHTDHSPAPELEPAVPSGSDADKKRNKSSIQNKRHLDPSFYFSYVI